jgi:arginase family enzyme
LEWAQRVGIRVVPMDRFDNLWDHVRDARLPIYLSLDMDVLDETAAPGVSAPTPEGLTTTKLYETVRRLAPRLIAMDVVETSPPLDQDGRTARAAAWAILSVAMGRHR